MRTSDENEIHSNPGFRLSYVWRVSGSRAALSETQEITTRVVAQVEEVVSGFFEFGRSAFTESHYLHLIAAVDF